MKNRGISLLEVLVACGLMVLCLTALSGFVLPATKLATRVNQSTYQNSKSSVSFDKILSDIQSGDALLRQWPPTGTATFASNVSGDIIIRIPRIDSSGTLLTDQFDIVIYANESQNGSTLRQITRYTASLLNGTASAASRSGIVVTDVSSWRTSYFNLDRFIANGSTTSFTLSAPYWSAANQPIRELWHNGAERISGGQGAVSGSTASLNYTPANNSEVEATYSINPQTAQSSGVLISNGVQINMSSEIKIKNPDNSDKAIQRVYETRGVLRNR